MESNQPIVVMLTVVAANLIIFIFLRMALVGTSIQPSTQLPMAILPVVLLDLVLVVFGAKPEFRQAVCHGFFIAMSVIAVFVGIFFLKERRRRDLNVRLDIRDR